jgi:hypothetical protein
MRISPTRPFAAGRLAPRLFAAGLAVLLAFTACAAPGAPVSPQPGDFAFLEVQLQG